MAKELTTAAGSPPRHAVVYLLFFLYAAAADLDDLARGPRLTRKFKRGLRGSHPDDRAGATMRR